MRRKAAGRIRVSTIARCEYSVSKGSSQALQAAGGGEQSKCAQRENCISACSTRRRATEEKPLQTQEAPGKIYPMHHSDALLMLCACNKAEKKCMRCRARRAETLQTNKKKKKKHFHSQSRTHLHLLSDSIALTSLPSPWRLPFPASPFLLSTLRGRPTRSAAAICCRQSQQHQSALCRSTPLCASRRSVG